ncbi:unnamed protein product [Vitrella brassicaformis CCMP3155]|uniref:Uncharacterized protein n=2 Tax=Vitrella brassicaformis TaxID=1169539 RepID=A0A0G4GRD3_VITBC|nr:unnamed protein product [Vitrella brassicaformis CCMP3155]|eukprot:CEM33103.1 unnamed protein product [Vitrella brassicaformis CCMP3155]
MDASASVTITVNNQVHFTNPHSLCLRLDVLDQAILCPSLVIFPNIAIFQLPRGFFAIVPDRREEGQYLRIGVYSKACLADLSRPIAGPVLLTPAERQRFRAPLLYCRNVPLHNLDAHDDVELHNWINLYQPRELAGSLNAPMRFVNCFDTDQANMAAPCLHMILKRTGTRPVHVPAPAPVPADPLLQSQRFTHGRPPRAERVSIGRQGEVAVVRAEERPPSVASMRDTFDRTERRSMEPLRPPTGGMYAPVSPPLSAGPSSADTEDLTSEDPMEIYRQVEELRAEATALDKTRASNLEKMENASAESIQLARKLTRVRDDKQRTEKIFREIQSLAMGVSKSSTELGRSSGKWMKVDKDGNAIANLDVSRSSTALGADPNVDKAQNVVMRLDVLRKEEDDEDQQLGELEAEVQTLEGEVRYAEARHAQTIEADELHEQLDEAERQYNDSRVACEEIKKSIAATQRKMAELDNQRKQKEDELGQSTSSLKHTAATNRIQLLSTRQKLQTIQEEIADTQQRATSVQKEEEEKSRELEDTNRDMRYRQQQWDDHQRSTTALQLQLRSRQEEQSSLEQSIKDMSAQLEDGSRFQEIEQELSRTTQALDERNREAQLLEEQAKKQEEEAALVRNDQQALLAELEQTQSNIRHRESEVKEQQQARALHEKQVAELRDRIALLAQRASESDQKIAATQSTSQQRQASCEQEAAQLQQAIQQMEEAFARERKALYDREKQQNDFRQMLDERRGHVKEEQDAAQTLEKQLEQHRADVSSMQREVKTQEDEIASMEERVQQLQTLIDQCRQESQVSDQADSAQEARLQQEIERMSDETAAIEANIQAAQQALQQAKEDIKRKEEAGAELSTQLEEASKKTDEETTALAAHESRLRDEMLAVQRGIQETERKTQDIRFGRQRLERALSEMRQKKAAEEQAHLTMKHHLDMTSRQLEERLKSKKDKEAKALEELNVEENRIKGETQAETHREAQAKDKLEELLTKCDANLGGQQRIDETDIRSSCRRVIESLRGITVEADHDVRLLKQAETSFFHYWNPFHERVESWKKHLTLESQQAEEDLRKTMQQRHTDKLPVKSMENCKKTISDIKEQLQALQAGKQIDLERLGVALQSVGHEYFDIQCLVTTSLIETEHENAQHMELCSTEAEADFEKLKEDEAAVEDALNALSQESPAEAHTTPGPSPARIDINATFQRALLQGMASRLPKGMKKGRALVVGCNYQRSRGGVKLRGACVDAIVWSYYLLSCGWVQSEVVTLIDTAANWKKEERSPLFGDSYVMEAEEPESFNPLEGIKSRLATRTNILATLTEFARSAEPDENIVFIFAGAGALLPVRSAAAAASASSRTPQIGGTATLQGCLLPCDWDQQFEDAGDTPMTRRDAQLAGWKDGGTASPAASRLGDESRGSPGTRHQSRGYNVITFQDLAEVLSLIKQKARVTVLLDCGHSPFNSVILTDAPRAKAKAGVSPQHLIHKGFERLGPIVDYSRGQEVATRPREMDLVPRPVNVATNPSIGPTLSTAPEIQIFWAAGLGHDEAALELPYEGSVSGMFSVAMVRAICYFDAKNMGQPFPIVRNIVSKAREFYEEVQRRAPKLKQRLQYLLINCDEDTEFNLLRSPYKL